MSTNSFDAREFFKKYTMIIALGLIWFLFGVLSMIKFGKPIFWFPRNGSNLLRQMTITGFLASGMLLVIVTGGIDLSVGSVTGFISAVAAWVQVKFLPGIIEAVMPNASIGAQGVVITVIAIITALAVGLAVGLFEGSIIAYLGVPAFIVTLAGMLIFRGGVLGVTGGKTIVPIESSFVYLAQGYVNNLVGWGIAILVVIGIFANTFLNRKKKQQYGFEQPEAWVDILKSCGFSAAILGLTAYLNSYRGIPLPVLLLAFVALIVHYITQNTRFGRYVYALGGNKEATRLSGINIKANIFKVHLMMGLLGGMAGIILTGYVAAGTTGGGVNYELDAIASCVIGGTSLMGGSGTILGAIIGALVMTSLMNGMSVMNMPIFWQYIIKGMVLIIAVFFDIASKKKTV